MFAISANPDATLDGIKNYGGVAKENGTMLNFLSNIGSTEATKLANVDEITGKLTDDLGVDKYVSKSGKAAPQLKSILLQINNYGPKQLRNFTADLSNKILSYPDQMIGRPLYLGEFVRVFEDHRKRDLRCFVLRRHFRIKKPFNIRRCWPMSVTMAITWTMPLTGSCYTSFSTSCVRPTFGFPGRVHHGAPLSR